VNNDGELPIDIAETEAMEELLERETQMRGIPIYNKNNNNDTLARHYYGFMINRH
jgi:hypothetical protein